jgi:lysozyme
MKISNDCLKMIVHHEGKRNKPYRCPALLFTVGVGHVLYPEQNKLKLEDRISFKLKPEDDRFFTDEEVYEILQKDLRRFERGVLRLCPMGLTQHRFDALVSFAFNVGLGNLQRSTLRMKHNRADYDGAAQEFLKWSKAAGKVLRGLLIRRTDEMNLYKKEALD